MATFLLSPLQSRPRLRRTERRAYSRWCPCLRGGVGGVGRHRGSLVSGIASRSPWRVGLIARRRLPSAKRASFVSCRIRGVIPETTPAGRQACTGRVLIGRVYAASVANSIGSTIEGLSFSGLLPCIRPHAHQPSGERPHQVPRFSRADGRTAHCSSLTSHSRLAVSLSCASGLGGLCCWSKKYAPLAFATSGEVASHTRVFAPFSGLRDAGLRIVIPKSISGPLLRLNPVATSPGWKQFAVTPVPSSRRASSVVNRMLASLVSQ